MDRISQLPNFIVHHILSFFKSSHDSPAEVVRMSVLSKTWFELTASFPVLYFKIDNFTCRESFFKYVEYTTSRFCHQNLTAHKFKLVTTIQEPAELDFVNKCLELVLKKGVKVFLIDINYSSEFPSSAAAFAMPRYCLPSTLLLSVSVLQSLTIRGCKLPSSLMVDDVKFKSLIELALVDVPIDDEVIKHLTTSCPLLQELFITACPGFKRFCVYGHQNLHEVVIHYNTPVERIDIEAPNLSYLFVADWNEIGAPQMNLASCKKLKTMSYFGPPLPNSNDFTDFLSNLPVIENLVLVTTSKCNNLKWSSHSLRTLVIHSTCDLEEIEFSAPNLVLFIYSCNPHLLWPVVDKRWPLGGKRLLSVTDSTHLKACMQCYPDGCIDALWFQKLRLFMDKKNGFKVLNLYIHAIYSQKFTEFEKLKAIELPPYELEHVELQLEGHEESLAHIAFVEAVLWCCRPRSLTLRFPFEEQSDVIKFTYKKLLEQEDQSHTTIQIVWPSSSGSRKHLMDLKSLSMALPCEGKTISFIKE